MKNYVVVVEPILIMIIVFFVAKYSKILFAKFDDILIVKI